MNRPKIPLKERVRDYLPPLVFDWIIKLTEKKVQFYPSYQDAKKNCPSSSYEDKDLVEMIAEKTRRFNDKLNHETHTVFHPTTLNILLSVGIAMRERERERELNVIDIGGACGTYYYYFKKIYSNKVQIKWYVVETPTMCSAARSFENDELKFFDSWSLAAKQLGEVDLILLSGTLQYFENPRKSLSEIVQLGASYIKLARLSLTTGVHDLISVQKSWLSHNGIGEFPEGFIDREISYPHSNMVEKDFLEILEANYQCKVKFDDQFGIYPVLIESPIVGYGLLLERK